MRSGVPIMFSSNNTAVTVYIPAADAAEITESGLALSISKDIQVVSTDKD